MGVLNVRIDPKTAAYLDRAARESGRTKSELVREALQVMADQRASAAAPPAETIAHLIGSWDSGGMRLSERTGERFAQLLRETKDANRAGRRRTACSAD
jgi:hypothetical protein